MPLEIGVFLSIDFGVFFAEDGVIVSFELLLGVLFCDALRWADFGVTDSEAEKNKTKLLKQANEKSWKMKCWENMAVWVYGNKCMEMWMHGNSDFSKCMELCRYENNDLSIWMELWNNGNTTITTNNSSGVKSNLYSAFGPISLECGNWRDCYQRLLHLQLTMLKSKTSTKILHYYRTDFQI